MDETTMPAVEAQESLDRVEKYELAFHALPTIADGEVARFTGELRALIASHKGEVFETEEPGRFTLAYEMRKAIDGRYMRFTSSWFGWMRFTLSRTELESLKTELDHRNELIRYLLIRLTKTEEAHPHKVFEKTHEPVTVGEGEDAPQEVSEEDLNKSLEEITS